MIRTITDSFGREITVTECTDDSGVITSVVYVYAGMTLKLSIADDVKAVELFDTYSEE